MFDLLHSLTLEQSLIFFSLALLAEILGTLGGFGSSLFFIPIASFFFDFQTVLGITGVFHVFSNLTKIGIFRQGVDYKVVLWIGIPSVITVLIGAYFSAYFSSRVLEFIMGAIIIGMGFLFLFYKPKPIPVQPYVAVAGGSLAGLLSGILGTGGAIRGLVLTRYNLSVAAFIATSAWIDLAVDLSRSVVYIAEGYINWGASGLLIILLIISVLGNFIGKWILSKVEQEVFTKWVLWMVILTGATTIIRLLY
jgi:uncharacterized membrane protein YfcA